MYQGSFNPNFKTIITIRNEYNQYGELKSFNPSFITISRIPNKNKINKFMKNGHPTFTTSSSCGIIMPVRNQTKGRQ